MNETLLRDMVAERAETHGDFSDTSKCDQRLKEDMRAWKRNWHLMKDHQRTALDMIAQKIARILTGNPDSHDHWQDIAGYAMLVCDRLPRKESAAPACNDPDAPLVETNDPSDPFRRYTP